MYAIDFFYCRVLWLFYDSIFCPAFCFIHLFVSLFVGYHKSFIFSSWHCQEKIKKWNFLSEINSTALLQYPNCQKQAYLINTSGDSQPLTAVKKLCFLLRYYKQGPHVFILDLGEPQVENWPAPVLGQNF